MYDAGAWRDCFVTVGSGAAALTGLVFVAMSMHLAEIVAGPRHRHRARTILTALTAGFIRCSLVLMGGQTARDLALEIFLVLIGAEFILFASLSSARRASRDAQPGVLIRTFASFVCLAVEQAGAVIVFSGDHGPCTPSESA
jgi:hypothetical protein